MIRIVSTGLPLRAGAPRRRKKRPQPLTARALAAADDFLGVAVARRAPEGRDGVGAGPVAQGRPVEVARHAADRPGGPRRPATVDRCQASIVMQRH